MGACGNREPCWGQVLPAPQSCVCVCGRERALTGSQIACRRVRACVSNSWSCWMKDAGGERYFRLCSRQMRKTGSAKETLGSQEGACPPPGRVGKRQSGCWALPLGLMLAPQAGSLEERPQAAHLRSVPGCRACKHCRTQSRPLRV